MEKVETEITNRNFKAAIKIENYKKSYKDFDLGPINLEIPQGFVTAIIGENGAGKSTLLDMLGGISHYKEGNVTWLGQYKNLDEGNARNEIGWCAGNRYFPENWTMRNVKGSVPLAFNNFSMENFHALCTSFNLSDDSKEKHPKTLAQYSDGNKARLAIASVMARDTKLLILDEPDSALDPVIRDTLCSKFRQYINNGNGETSILFSTHNVADMESIVDYVVYLSYGKVIEQGFVEDLLEEYFYVHGPKGLLEMYKSDLESFYAGEENQYFEGLCKADIVEVFAKESEIVVEKPTIQQLSVLILRKWM
ncbi:MAG: ABC transporter ATP-binding protein [Treponema sp.]|nr:ABC transporter ATP-binding protein [Treponema sp.]